MPGQSEAPLVAVVLPRAEAAAAVTAAWDRDEAVAVLDPAAPAAVLRQVLGVVRPTHLEDRDGRRPHRGGQPVPAGTAAVVTTSGTTGTPKAVELTVTGREAIGRGFAAALGVHDDERALVCLPLHHVAGLAILGRARVSGAAITVHAGFDLDAVAAAPRAERATNVSVVPTMLRRLLDAGAPVAEYRTIIVGGAPTHPALRRRAEAAGARVVDAYGLSETWGGIVLDGEPLPEAEARLSESSEVLLRGPMLMRGYRHHPADTAAAFTPDGWFRTGDLGEWSRDGRLRVVDRARDIVISGGVNVSPSAVEAVLAEHPDVGDVCVAGRPDAEWGERVVAYVVPRPGGRVPALDALREFARDRLAAAQLPRQVVAVDAIPRTAGGKARRRELPTS
jgi:O-succinylbenzoic acid--CoA ligase